ncbi:MAG: TIGR03435 family protein [Terracidiphilus sp.]
MSRNPICNRILWLAAFVLAAAAGLPLGAQAQLVHPDGGARPSFEVATIKPSHGDGPTNYGIAEGRFNAENATVAELIKLAYKVESDDQLQKGPDWTNSDRFDIEAKTTDEDGIALEKLAPTERFDQYRLMVQSLLAERFKLAVSTREKVLPVYALVVGGNGPKLTATATGTRHMPWLWGGSRGDLTAKSVSMDFFAGWLSGRADAGGRVVVDKTGLNGIYDFTLKWTPMGTATMESTGSAAGGPAPEATGPSLLTVLEAQLGLKLEPAKAPVQVLVIDHVEQPSAN